MQIEAIETFLCIAETGGFHTAARKLNVTQTTVSARIKALETNIGRRLFDRGYGGTVLSDFGRQFRPHAEQLVTIWRFASEDLPGQLANRITMRIGAQLSIWDPLLVDAAVRLEDDFGQLVFTLNYDHSMNVVDAVANHVLDTALCHQKPADNRIAYRELEPEAMLLVERDRPSAREEKEPLFINLQLGESYQAHIIRSVDPSVGQTIFLGNCMMALRYLVRRGGQGYFPAYCLKDYLEGGRLSVVQDAPRLEIPCYLVFRKEAYAEQIDDLITCLSQLRQPES